MNRSNLYIFVYASVMVIIVAAILSLAATGLKPFQDKNEEIAKKLDILRSVGHGLEASDAESKNDYVEAEFEKYITESFVVNSKGENVEGVDAFTVDLHKENVKAADERNLPVFLCTQDNGSKNFIFPVRGKGLWGPLWGYVALNGDLVSIYGVIFDHKGETPGLGAEINTDPFQDQFKDKKIFNSSGEFTSIQVNKAGVAETESSVDAISGGTITSKGLEAMLYDCLTVYESFINKQK
jgi:Na+-transporting NADH:ubiquinone oxidoreductase subunit C